MYGDPFAEPLARLRSGAHRLRLHADAAARTDRRADDVRRQGSERGLRSARWVSDPAARGVVAPKQRRRTRSDAEVPAAGSEIARVTGDRASSSVAAAGRPRPDAAAAIADRQLARCDAARAVAAVHRRRENASRKSRKRSTRGETTSEDVVREYLARLSLYDRHGPTLALDARAEPGGDCRRARASMPSARPAACAVRFTACRSSSRTTSTCSVCRRPADRARSSIIARGSIRAWLRGCVAAAPSMLGKANLDEFPFGDFGISTVGGTIGNAFDPR